MNLKGLLLRLGLIAFIVLLVYAFWLSSQPILEPPPNDIPIPKPHIP